MIDVDGVEKFDLTEQDDPHSTRPKPQNTYDPSKLSGATPAGESGPQKMAT